MQYQYSFVKQYLSSQLLIPSVHHLAYITLGLIVGIWCSSMHYSHFKIVTLCAPVLFFILLNYTKNWSLYYPFLFIVPFFVGAYIYQSQTAAYTYVLQGFTHNFHSITARVNAIEPLHKSRFGHRIILTPISIDNNSAFNNKINEYTIAIYTNTFDHLCVDDIIEVNAVYFSDKVKDSFKNYLIKQGIIANLFTKHFNFRLCKRPLFSCARICAQIKQNLINQVRHQLSPTTQTLMGTLFFGYKEHIAEEDHSKQMFKNWGISHYLARSGLHLVIIVIIWSFLLRLIPVSFVIKQLFILIIIIMYAILSWSSISFERALYMFLLYKSSQLLYRPMHYVHLVTVITLLVLLINPMQLFFLDFQLSFGLTFALAWFNHMQQIKKLSLP